VKARAVKGLRRGQRLDEAMQRIVAVRLEELCAFMPTAADPAQVEALHDMRIAAKRLRYALELTAFCFGPYAAKAARRTKALQDVLGEIHDCDVTLPRLRAVQEELGGEAPEGLETAAQLVVARREALHGAFLVQWRELERSGFRARLEYAIGERPEPKSPLVHIPLDSIAPQG